jgi:hypothetical protein
VIAAAALAVTLVAAAAQSAPPDAAGVKDPIWVSSWGSVPAGIRTMDRMVLVPGDFRPFAQSESVNPEDIARRLKAIPPGRRAVLINRYCHSFWGQRADQAEAGGKAFPTPWPDAAIKEIAKDWPRILHLLKYCGGTIDLLVGDFEEWGRLSTWWATDAQIDALRADARWNEPRYGLPPLGQLLGDLAAVPASSIRAAGRGGTYMTWNWAMGKYAAGAMNVALWEPAIATFPKLIGCNYQGQRSMDRPAPEGNGHQQPQDNLFGNAASPSLYGEVSSIVNLFIDPSDPTRISWTGNVHMKRTPWHSFLMCQQQARSCVRGAPTVPLIPWVAHLSYEGDAAGQSIVSFPKDPRCYDENVRQVALLGTPTILWWRSMEAPPQPDTSRLDALISDINAHTLGRIKEPADVEPISFLSEVVVTGGRRHDGTWVWRVSVSPEVAMLREVGTGREWAPTAETLGFWVETAEKAAPKWEVARRRDPSEPSLARPIKPAPPPGQ